MADNWNATPGTGGALTTDQITSDSSHAQVIKLAVSADGDRTLVPATSANGITVDVTRITGNVTVVDGGTALKVQDGGNVLSVDDGSSSLTVDAPVATPVFVRLSDGAAAITALPITDNSGTITVDDGGTSLTVDGAVTVTGTATVTQGTAAAVASGWPVKITDGTDTVGISTVSATKALKVDVVQEANNPVKQDKTAFTEGTDKMSVIGGVYNETLAGDPSEDQASVARITAKRALHVNLRNNSGTEIGTAADPVEVCLRNAAGTELGTSADPVEVGLRNSGGTELSTQTAPVLVAATYGDQTRVTSQVALTASQTGVTVWDPATGKKFVVTDLFLVVSAAGTCTFFDGTDAAGNTLLKGTWAIADKINHSFNRPWISSTADNILKYTSGAGFAAEITVHGYEITP